MPGTIIISGAARGIGRACAERFIAAGWRVGAIDRDARGLEELAAGFDGAVIPLPADVTDASALTTMLARLGTGVSGCINAAGTFPMSSLATADAALYRAIFDINVLGTILLSQAAVPVMEDGGVIINFASINAFLAKPEQLLYSAAKAAIVSLTRSLAIDLAPRRIRVNAVAPGPVATEGMQGNPGRLEELAAMVPLGRAAMPAEIAELVFWLATGEGAQYITGETIVAGGGLAMR